MKNDATISADARKALQEMTKERAKVEYVARVTGKPVRWYRRAGAWIGARLTLARRVR